MPTWSAASVRPSHANRVVPAGAWAKILRSPEADYAALAIPFNMELPAGFQYQMPIIDARNPDAISFVVECDPPQLSLGVNIPCKLELKLMAIDYWQQAAWAHMQHHDPAARMAYVAESLKKVQAVLRQAQKQQAVAAGTGSAQEQQGGAGGDEGWPYVVLPSLKKPSGPSRRIQIQGPTQGTPAAVQLQHVPQHSCTTRDSSAGGSSLAVQPAAGSSSQSAAATAPSRSAQRILRQERVPEQGWAGAALADAAETSAVGPLAGTHPDAAQGALGPGGAELPQGQHLHQSGQASLQPEAAPEGPAPAQHQRRQAVKAGTMAVAEAAEQAAESASGHVKQPTQAADAVQQQPTQAGAVVVPDAAIQAAVEAQVRAAMAHQMEAVGEALQAMQADTRLTTESNSRQMSDLRGKLQQARRGGPGAAQPGGRPAGGHPAAAAECEVPGQQKRWGDLRRRCH